MRLSHLLPSACLALSITLAQATTFKWSSASDIPRALF